MLACLGLNAGLLDMTAPTVDDEYKTAQLSAFMTVLFCYIIKRRSCHQMQQSRPKWHVMVPARTAIALHDVQLIRCRKLLLSRDDVCQHAPPIAGLHDMVIPTTDETTTAT